MNLFLYLDVESLFIDLFICVWVCLLPVLLFYIFSLLPQEGSNINNLNLATGGMETTYDRVTVFNVYYTEFMLIFVKQQHEAKSDAQRLAYKKNFFTVFPKHFQTKELLNTGCVKCANILCIKSIHCSHRSHNFAGQICGILIFQT